MLTRSPLRVRAVVRVLTAGALLIGVVAAGTPARAVAVLTVAALRADDLDAPIGIDNPTPVLSWRATATAKGAVQAAVEVQAATNPWLLAVGRPDLWDTGRRRQSDPFLRYAGAALGSRALVYWRVRVWDGAGAVSRWSAPTSFELGLLRAGDWRARWITDPGWTPTRYGAVTTHPVTVTFPATSARYVKLNVTTLGLTPANDSGHYVQLAEVEVHGPAGATGNLAAGRAVTPSSSLEGYGWSSRLLTDGVRDTNNGAARGWTTNPRQASTDQSATPAWVVIDLGSVHSIGRVVLYPRTDALSVTGATAGFPVDFTVQAGTTSTTAGFDPVRTVTGQPNPAPATVYTPGGLPVLAKEFTATTAVRRARLYVSGVGVFIASLNGRKVGDAVLEPANTDLRDRVEYATYDVTAAIRRGRNAIGVRLGTGVASITAAPGRYAKFTGTQSMPKAIVQLEVTYADGRRQTVATDSSWRSTHGATVLSNWFGGEDYDARREIAGWDVAGTDRRRWSRAEQTTAPAAGTALTGRQSPPLRVVDQLPGTLVGTPAAGVQLYDLGTNIAGWPQLRVDAPAGTVVSLHPGETLTGGRVSQASTGSPIFDTVTSDGTARTWHPEFMYHGFRYLEVRGVTAGVTVSAVRGLVVRAANDHVGSFDSSDGVLNRVHALVDRAIQSNMYSVLTDCPHREKLGWLEETHLVFGAIMRNYDVAAYARNIVRNIAEAQLPNGLVPDIAPEYAVFGGGFRDDPNWGSAIILLPWEMYRNYGDTATLRRYYPNMRAYLSYLDTRASGGLLRYGSSGLGDWGELLSGANRTNTDLVANFGYYRAADALARIAAALGDTAGAVAYRAKADAIRQAFQAAWYRPDTDSVANGSQASLILALDIGAVPAAGQAAAFATLTSAIRANGDHLNVGEIALPSAFRVLSGFGRADLVHRLTTQPTSPSYGFFVAGGATSLPEYWNLTGSQNHFMLGAIDEWFSSHLAGIQQTDDSVAYRKLVFRPSVVGGMTRASAGYRTPYGSVASAWTLVDGAVRLNVTVPVGSTATVYVPLTSTVPAGQRPSAEAGAVYQGVETLTDGQRYARFAVGAGNWSFGAQAPVSG